jgi:16S rRNA (adenine1518-N6/adenine1519-N6)-dimethyltransferase
MTGFSLPPLNIPSLLRKYDLRPSKGLGQNFLVDISALQAVVTAANLKPTDAVLEIGPGLGSLTRYLSLAARSITAVELDMKLFPALRSVLVPYKNVKLIQGDILKLDSAEIMDSPEYVVVANIPYYITSMVIRHLLEATHRPNRIILTVQEEVADRICAPAGKLSLLALSVQVYGKPTIRSYISAEAFYPPPKVDSAILCVDIYSQPIIPPDKLDKFFTLIKAGFSQKRKTLRNAFSGGLRINTAESEQLLARAGINPQRRAETLTLEEWGNLVNQY